MQGKKPNAVFDLSEYTKCEALTSSAQKNAFRIFNDKEEHSKGKSVAFAGATGSERDSWMEVLQGTLDVRLSHP